MSRLSDNNTKAGVKVILALTLVHFTGDFYSSFTTPLFPLFVQKLNLSLVQIGIIAGLSRFLPDRQYIRQFFFLLHWAG